MWPTISSAHMGYTFSHADELGIWLSDYAGGEDIAFGESTSGTIKFDDIIKLKSWSNSPGVSDDIKQWLDDLVGQSVVGPWALHGSSNPAALSETQEMGATMCFDLIISFVRRILINKNTDFGNLGFTLPGGNVTCDTNNSKALF